MAGARRGRLALLLVVLLLLSVTVAGVVLLPQIAPSLVARNGRVARARRKLLALRAFALFRAPGDRAVLRAGEPARASKRAAMP